MFILAARKCLIAFFRCGAPVFGVLCHRVFLQHFTARGAWLFDASAPVFGVLVQVNFVHHFPTAETFFFRRISGGQHLAVVPFVFVQRVALRKRFAAHVAEIIVERPAARHFFFFATCVDGDRRTARLLPRRTPSASTLLQEAAAQPPKRWQEDVLAEAFVFTFDHSSLLIAQDFLPDNNPLPFKPLEIFIQGLAFTLFQRDT